MKNIINKALEIQKLYREFNSKEGREKWSYKEYTEGFVGDVGDLMKLIMAKSNLRGHKEDDLDGAISHELSDCLWSIIVISSELGIDIENEFIRNMDELGKKVKEKLNKI